MNPRVLLFSSCSAACVVQDVQERFRWRRRAAKQLDSPAAEKPSILSSWLIFFHFPFFGGCNFAWYVIGLDRSNFQGGFWKTPWSLWNWGSHPPHPPSGRAPPPHRIGQTSKIAPNTCWFSRPRKITVLIICLVRRSTMTVGRRPAIFLARGLKNCCSWEHISCRAGINWTVSGFRYFTKPASAGGRNAGVFQLPLHSCKCTVNVSSHCL